jgi:hypothetical protein
MTWVVEVFKRGEPIITRWFDTKEEAEVSERQLFKTWWREDGPYTVTLNEVTEN